MRRLPAILLAGALALQAVPAMARTVQLDIRAPLDEGEVDRPRKTDLLPLLPEDAVMIAHVPSLRIGPGSLALLDPDPVLLLEGFPGQVSLSGDAIVLTVIQMTPPPYVYHLHYSVVLEVPAVERAKIRTLPAGAGFRFRNGNADALESTLDVYTPDGVLTDKFLFSVPASFSGVVTAVPVPPALALSVAGLATLAGLRRRGPGRSVSPWRGGP